MDEGMDERMVNIAVADAEVAAMRLRQAVASAYFWRGFDGDQPALLLMGLVEELGELAELVNIDQSPDFSISERKQRLLENLREHVAAEIGDVLTYAIALANAYEVTPTFHSWRKQRKPVSESELAIYDTSEAVPLVSREDNAP